MNPKPQATLVNALYLDLAVGRTEEQVRSRIYIDDDGTIAAFHSWLSEQGIYPIAGHQLGPGFIRGAYPIAHAPAIRVWLTAHRVSQHDG